LHPFSPPPFLSQDNIIRSLINVDGTPPSLTRPRHRISCNLRTDHPSPSLSQSNPFVSPRLPFDSLLCSLPLTIPKCPDHRVLTFPPSDCCILRCSSSNCRRFAFFPPPLPIMGYGPSFLCVIKHCLTLTSSLPGRLWAQTFSLPEVYQKAIQSLYPPDFLPFWISPEMNSPNLLPVSSVLDKCTDASSVVPLSHFLQVSLGIASPVFSTFFHTLHPRGQHSGFFCTGGALRVSNPPPRQSRDGLNLAYYMRLGCSPAHESTPFTA